MSTPPMSPQFFLEWNRWYGWIVSWKESFHTYPGFARQDPCDALLSCFADIEKVWGAEVLAERIQRAGMCFANEVSREVQLLVLAAWREVL